MKKSIQLFITCLPDTFRPSIGKAVLNVFAKIGIEVNFPLEQTCCGQPAFNAGMRRQARKLAIHTIQAFEKSRDPIILPSGSCTAMLRKNYLELFKNDPEWLPRAQRIAQRTYEFTEYLVDIIGVWELGASYPGPVTYHPSCHLHRSLGIEKQPLLLLSHVKDSTKPDQNLEIKGLPNAEECCGFGGVFSVEHPHISKEMLQRKINHIQETQVPTVVTADTGCLLHIAGGLHRQGKKPRVVHIAEVLSSGS